jgi:hypothetical protein
MALPNNVHITNNDAEVTEIFETTNTPFSSQLSCLTPDTSVPILNNIICNIIEYVTLLTKSNFINEVLIDKNVGKKFCSSFAVISTNFENNFTLTIENSLALCQFTTNIKIKKQAKSIISIIAHLFFKDSKIKNKNFTACGPQCKIKSKTCKFIFFDYNLFHGVFCTKKFSLPNTLLYQLEGFENFPEPIPQLAQSLIFELQI